MSVSLNRGWKKTFSNQGNPISLFLISQQQKIRDHDKFLRTLTRAWGGSGAHRSASGDCRHNGSDITCPTIHVLNKAISTEKLSKTRKINNIKLHFYSPLIRRRATIERHCSYKAKTDGDVNDWRHHVSCSIAFEIDSLITKKLVQQKFSANG